MGKKRRKSAVKKAKRKYVRRVKLDDVIKTNRPTFWEKVCSWLMGMGFRG